MALESMIVITPVIKEGKEEEEDMEDTTRNLVKTSLR